MGGRLEEDEVGLGGGGNRGTKPAQIDENEFTAPWTSHPPNHNPSLIVAAVFTPASFWVVPFYEGQGVTHLSATGRPKLTDACWSLGSNLATISWQAAGKRWNANSRPVNLTV